jgi:NAD(P)-dependent dehydrogenase (short-subunit alcohol dehydrogenase family)
MTASDIWIWRRQHTVPRRLSPTGTIYRDGQEQSCIIVEIIFRGLLQTANPAVILRSKKGSALSTILITGTSKGIGFETALAFARAGHTVFATMRNPARSPQLAEIAAKESLPIAISQMDVDSDESVCDGMAAILAKGPIDVLVDNAGVEAVGSVEEQPLSVFRAIMETNYFGVIRCAQAVIPHMRQRRSGCIINVSSVAGRFSNSPFAAYSASKWALEALTEALATEMKTFKVRVALIEPGIIDTAMAQRIKTPGDISHYAQVGRYATIFQNSLQQPVPPSLVAGKILEVADSGTWQLRHPVGPDALPFINLRKTMTDEDWIDFHASDDATFFARLAKETAGW